ncbi:hypothetical protein ZOSMA_134G00100 [Zostera marina]|uniref:Uncharacterized protein n=1 Tax=Zostera marina TaxID=29655 RepID=A0A0K9PYS4_ZOSMR|nr:hypothetical protein ZOSMA_134G00100 [Zostera marina]
MSISTHDWTSIEKRRLEKFKPKRCRCRLVGILEREREMEYEKGTRVFEGPVKCTTWIRWSGKRNDGNPQNLPQKQTLAVIIKIFSFDSLTLSLSSSPLAKLEIDGNPLTFAMHPSGDEFICATTDGCRMIQN